MNVIAPRLPATKARVWHLLPMHEKYSSAPKGRGLALALALEANKVPDPLPVVQQTLTDIAFAPGMRYSRDIGGPVMEFDVSPDGSVILTGQGILYGEPIGITSNDLVLWDLQSGEQLRRFVGHSDLILGIAIHPDGRSAISASIDGTIFHWNLASGEQIRQFELGGDFIPFDIDISPDGSRLIANMCRELDPTQACVSDGQVLMWDIESGEVLQAFVGDGFEMLTDITFSPDGRYIYSGSRVFTREALQVSSRSGTWRAAG